MVEHLVVVEEVQDQELIVLLDLQHNQEQLLLELIMEMLVVVTEILVVVTLLLVEVVLVEQEQVLLPRMLVVVMVELVFNYQ